MFALSDGLIHETGWTSVQFVLLMITGDAADSVSDTFAIPGSVIITGVIVPQEIGMVYQNEEDSEDKVGEYLLCPDANIWVRFTGGHFDAIVEHQGEFLVYDPFLHNEDECRVMNHVDAVHAKLSDALRRKSDRGRRMS
jgi:hypothetical protein